MCLIMKHLVHMRKLHIRIPEIQLRQNEFLLEKKAWSMDDDLVAQNNASEGSKCIIYIMPGDMYSIKGLVKSETLYKSE